MTKPELENYIETLKAIRSRDFRPIDLTGYDELFWQALTILEKQIDPDGWISWFCYENDFGAKGFESKPSCSNVDELWEILAA